MSEKSEVEKLREEAEKWLQQGNENKYNAIMKRIEELEEAEIEQEIREEEKEKRLEDAKKEAVSIIVGGEAVEGLPPQVAELIQIAVEDAVNKERSIYEQEIQHKEDAIKGLKQVIEEKNVLTQELTDQNEELIKDLEESSEETQKWIDKATQAERENQDWIQKHKNATSQLLEKDIEIDRLKSEIEDYQKAKVFGEREAQKIVEIPANQRAQELVQQIQKEYKHFNEFGSPLFVEAVAEDGTKEVIPRKEAESMKLPKIGNDCGEEDPVESDFRKDVSDVQPAADETDSDDRQTVPNRSEVTREEFEDLKQRVDHLYKVTGHMAS